MIGAFARFTVSGMQGPALTAIPVRGLSVSWPETPGAVSYRLRYRPKGGSWKTVTVKRPPKILCPLEPGIWQIGFRVFTVNGTGVWSASVDVTV